MSEQLKERNQIQEEFKWNLNTLFNSEEEWKNEIEVINKLVLDLVSYQGKLNNAEIILELFEKSNILDRKLNNVFTYASLIQAEDTRNSNSQSMYAKAYSTYVNASTLTAFITPEILSLDENALKEIVNNPILKDYTYLLSKLLKSKPHTLSGEKEQLLASFGEVFANPSETSSNLMNADMVFENVEDKDGNIIEVNSSNYILLQTSSDRVLRKNSFMSLYKAYKSHINTFASTYNGAVKLDTITAQIKNYNSSREMHMLNDDIDTQVYDNLINTIHNNMDKMHRYVDLRKKILQLDELHYYDIYAPLLQEKSKLYSYDQAKEMVLNAVKPLGEEYVNTVKQAYIDRWIDVFPNKGKRGGAFSSGSYDSNPYILTNFTGTLDSVSTLAHEMGHSMHTWYTNNNQPAHYANYTMFVAEVASTVNENLLIEQLLEKETDKKIRLSLLNQYLEGFKGTVYRQTMFAEFEKEAHAMAERGESLNPESLSNLYEKLIKQYFGENLVIDDEVKYEWARIPHFYNPFYVYVYATGYSSAVAISENILNKKENATENYLKFLKMGSSASPLEELKIGGVDLTTSTPIQIALDKFSKVLDEVEAIVKESK